VSGATNDYVVVFNSTANTAQIWFDDNWANTANRTQVATLSGVTLAQLQTMTVSSFLANGTAADPIVLDLGGDGVHFTSVENGVQFDLDANGQPEQAAWTTGNEGILGMDINHNDTIDSGNEIFSPFFNGGSFADSLSALASLDGNHDGKIDASDAEFNDLVVWQDANHDGVSDPGELSGLASLGISSISLDADDANDQIDGQTVTANGTFTKADGTTGNFVEVSLQTTPPPAPAAPAAADGSQAPATLPAESFDFTQLTTSLASNFTTIQNFTSGVDAIHIGHDLAGLTTGLSVAGTGNLALDLMAVLTTGSLVANGAAEVTVNGGSNAGTYAVVNDGTAGFDAAHDAVIKLANAAVLHTADFIV
jgi:hypothetical protein